MAMVLDLSQVKPSFARRLRAARRASQLTQQDLAGELGVALRSVSSWEDPHDERLPDGLNAVRIELLLGVRLIESPRRPPRISSDALTPEELGRKVRPLGSGPTKRRRARHLPDAA
jgi:transcriptional regulator with XRE-family HTH domain